jgi:nitroreductase
MKRRSFLKGTSVISVLLVGGVVWRAHDQGVFSTGEGRAYEPWQDWRSDPGIGPLALVRAGILAASPHNTQPWLFSVTDRGVELYADARRNLGTFDPYLREMYIGLGCTVENMMLMAAAQGYNVELNLASGALTRIPDKPEPVLAAALALSFGAAQKSSLEQAIPQRHTNRAAYDMSRPISPEILGNLANLAKDEPDLKLSIYTSDADRKKVSEVLVEATKTIIADRQMENDSQRWIRTSWSDVQTYRDGLTLDCLGLPRPMVAAAKIMPAMSAKSTGKYWLEQTREVHAAKSALFAMIAVRDRYDRSQSLRAGRVWQRIHLWATTQGLAAQPINQPMEVVDRERILNRDPQMAKVLAGITGDPDWQATFSFRMGYPTTEAPPSPRRPVEDVIM